MRDTDYVGLDRLCLVNYWMISGIANIGFLIFFLTQSIGGQTALLWLVNTRKYWAEERLAVSAVVVLLLVVAITSFVLGSRIKK